MNLGTEESSEKLEVSEVPWLSLGELKGKVKFLNFSLKLFEE